MGKKVLEAEGDLGRRTTVCCSVERTVGEFIVPAGLIRFNVVAVNYLLCPMILLCKSAQYFTTVLIHYVNVLVMFC